MILRKTAKSLLIGGFGKEGGGNISTETLFENVHTP